jgi:hypothetical protein
LHPFQHQALQRLCKRFGIDSQEIDSSLTYAENRTILEKSHIKTVEELADELSKTYTQKELFEFDTDYTSLKDTLEEILRANQQGTLLDWYLIGVEIRAKREMMSISGKDIGPRGWTGDMGKLMAHLSKDLRKRREELYDSVRFADRFRDWDAFIEEAFPIPGKKKGVLETFKISGGGLSWNQVRKYLLREQTIKTNVRPNLCWTCRKQFFSESAPVCVDCKTFACPDGHCFCKVAPEIQKAIDYEIMSKGPQPPRWQPINRKWLRTLHTEQSTSTESESSIEVSKGKLAVE